MNISMNCWKHLLFVPKKIGIFLMTCNNGKPKLWKRKYGEKIFKNLKEPIFKSKK